MSMIYEFSTNGANVLVQAEEQRRNGPIAVGRTQDVVQKAAQSFENALSGIRPIANGLIAQTKSLDSFPKSVEAKFGITLSGELGAILAKSSAEAHLEITLTWEHKDGG